MYTRSMLALLLVLTLATAASAKMKVSGESTCAKADPAYTIEVGVRPNHSFQIGKLKCTYTKAPEIGGIAAASQEDTYFTETTGNTSRTRGVAIVTMANGDKIYIPFDGAKWAFKGGTGKMAALKGKGTTKVTVAADGTSTGVISGTYTLPK